MTKIRIDVTINSKLYEKGPEVMDGAVKDAVKEIVETGATEAQTLADAFRKSGKYHDSLKGKVTAKGTSGRIKAYGGPRKMPYGAVLERGRFWATTGHRFAGYGVLSKAGGVMESRASGILQKHVDKAVEVLNS